ncbi:MAG: response regulator [Gemmataceae bacterium]|nr:response regulator [Gemmataceae bacterium]
MVTSGEDTNWAVVFDAEPAVCALLSLLLEREGFSVLRARSLNEAVAKCRDQTLQVHALVCDADEVTANTWLSPLVHNELPDLRVVVLSAGANPSSLRKYDGYCMVPKPFVCEQLMSAVRGSAKR